MTTPVVDASALLAILLAEAGADRALELIESESLVSTVNVTEVLTRLVEHGRDVDSAQDQIAELGPEIVPFDLQMARVTAALRPRTRQLGLSLGDRACLALGLLRGEPVVTADRAWADLDVGVTIEVIW